MAHIAFIFEVLALAIGLAAIHYGKELHARLIKTAGILLVVFATSGILCTGYYAIKYFFMGHYKHAYDFNIPMKDNMAHDHCSESVGD
ncbi:MAG: hypothetical protein K1X44_07230 [Alphaproteobacteria bacterium]|nr:hypothetical protein [Alphaproteobacteria bacterium]